MTNRRREGLAFGGSTTRSRTVLALFVVALLLGLSASLGVAQDTAETGLAKTDSPATNQEALEDAPMSIAAAVGVSQDGPRIAMSLKLDKPEAAIGETVKLNVVLDIPEEALTPTTRAVALAAEGAKPSVPTAYAEKASSERALAIGFVEFAAPSEEQLAKYSIELESLRPPADRGPHTGKVEAVFRVTPWALGDLEILPPPFRLSYLKPSFDDPSSSEMAPSETAVMLVSPEELADAAVLGVASQVKADAATGMLPAARPTRGAAVLALTPWERAVRAWPIIAALVVVAIIAWLLIRRAMRPTPERIVPADEWASTELDRLAAALPEDDEAVEEWHFSLGQIVRGYIARRWRFRAEEMTSYEVLRSLQTQAPDLSSAQRQELDHLLEEVDGVKFAREPASKLTCQDRLDRSRGFVQQTRPVEIDAAPTARADEAAPSSRAA